MTLRGVYRPNILPAVTNITSEAKTEQGERFWEVFKAQTGQDLETLKSVWNVKH